MESSSNNNSAVFFRVENNVGFIEFDQPDSKVNVLGSALMQRLNSILDEVSQKTTLRAIIFSSRKKDIFIAGADIKEIEGITQTAEGKQKSQAGQAVFDKIEDLKVPTIAVIDGAALGGGCELALACDYRIGTFNERISIGLPEVKLGIIPGFGGTYRLPKIVGLSQALKMILTGKILSSTDALKCGLFDKLYPQQGLVNFLFQFVDEISDQRISRRTKAKMMDWFLDHTILGQAVVFRTSRQSVLEATKGFYPAPLAALKVVQKTQGFSRRSALELEAESFAQLAVTDVSKNLVKLFYLSEKGKKYIPSGMEDIKPKPVHKCAVLGAGVMGGGIAHLLSDRGIRVRLKDINYEAVGKGLKAAYQIYRFSMKKKRIKKSEADRKMAHITGTMDYSGFASADLVIEAVVENMEIKKRVFRELSAVTGERTILCTNTSALSVREMASETQDPSRVIGFHFFNPVNRMPLIEVIKTDATSREAIVTTLNFARSLGKTPILVKDSCGFLVNRILLSYINEAGRILEEGESVESIDRTMTDFGMPMGPFLLSDEVGLDVGFKVLHILEEGLGERFKPVSIFPKVCEKGLLGKKSGSGFYIHGTKRMINSDIDSLLNVSSGGSRNESDSDESLNRMILIMINEAARCLEEGIIEDAGVVDIGMIMGTGFPPFRGGLLRYADSMGLGKIVDQLNYLKDKFHSPRFEPCAYLQDLKKRHQLFYHV